MCIHCGFPKWEEPPPEFPKINIYPIPQEEKSVRDPAIAERLHLAKFLTLVLRDDPKAIGLRLDADGWADLETLLTRANRYGFKLTRESLAEVAASSSGHRIEWDQPGNRIRAAIS